MKKTKLILPVLVGIIAGQVFAEGEGPLKISNTIRFGYNDNVYRVSSNEESSAYVRDILELSYLASLSDQTDLTLKARLDYRTDKENKIYPSLYAKVRHTVSPKLLLELSNNLQSGDRTSPDLNGRDDYLVNTLSFVPSYVLSPQDKLSAPVSYIARRHETSIESEDSDTITGGLSWQRELNANAWAGLMINQTMIDYVNRNSKLNTTLLAVEMSQTFSPELQGHVQVGATFAETEVGNVKNDSTNPYFSATLGYKPSPSTRLSASAVHEYKESDSSSYAARTVNQLILGAEHDFTAKITGKVKARLSDSEYDVDDQEAGTTVRSNESIDLECRVSYKLNRSHFLEAGVRYRESDYEVRSWDQNTVDIGWRVEL